MSNIRSQPRTYCWLCNEFAATTLKAVLRHMVAPESYQHNPPLYHINWIWRPVSKPKLIRTNIHPLELRDLAACEQATINSNKEILNQKHILESQRQRPQQPLGFRVSWKKPQGKQTTRVLYPFFFFFF